MNSLDAANNSLCALLFPFSREVERRRDPAQKLLDLNLRTTPRARDRNDA